MSSVARRVALRGSALLAGSLVVVGVATGAVLHLEATRALDRELLESTRGEEEHEGRHAAIEVDERDLRDDEAAGDRPTFRTEHGWRIAVVPDIHERGRVIEARARDVTWARSVGPFAVIYTAFATMVTILASGALFATVRAAFAPIERARREAESVLGLGQGVRLTAAAPEEIASLLAAVNALLDRLDAASAAQNRFTAEAAHELKTPITAIRGEIDVLLRHPRSEAEYREALVSVRDDVERLGRIVQSLLALARIDAGEASQGRALVRANEIVAAALAAERPTLTAAGCAVEVQVRADPEIEGNVPLLELALANLLRNAARYAPGAPVTVTVDATGPQARFVVHDGGPGFTPEVAASAFDRFARGAEARRKNPDGLGLGLPLTREVARRHGGDCRIEPGGGGARVVLTVATAPATGVG